MTVVGMCCVLNEQELLEPFLDHAEPLVDKMIIAEGAVVGHPFSTETGRSIDATNWILDMYKNAKKKWKDRLIIIRNSGKWRSKQDQQNIMLNHVEEGDWCWIFGVDELYLPDARKKFNHLIKKYPRIQEFIPSFIHFKDDGKKILVDSDTDTYRTVQRHQRFFKYQNFMTYVNHPTINDIRNLDTFYNQAYRAKRMPLGIPTSDELPRDVIITGAIGTANYIKEEEITVFHYGLCRDRLHRLRKHIYYLMRERDMGINDIISLLDATTEHMPLEKYIDNLNKSPKFKEVEFAGEHPLKNFKFKHSTLHHFNKSLVGFNEKPVK